MHNRKFGFELEYDTNWDDLEKVIRDIIRKYYGPYRIYCKNDIYETINNKRWHLKTDSGVASEICSPISIVTDLDKIYSVIDDLNHNCNLKPTKDCGFHVHIDVSDINKYHLVAYWISVERTINNLFPQYRIGNDTCSRYIKFNNKRSKKDVAKLYRKYKGDFDDRWRALNLSNYEDRGTAEIRLAESTANPEDVYCWVSFCINLIDYFASIEEEDPIDIMASDLKININDLIYNLNLDSRVKNWVKFRYKKYNK